MKLTIHRVPHQIGGACNIKNIGALMNCHEIFEVNTPRSGKGLAKILGNWDLQKALIKEFYSNIIESSSNSIYKKIYPKKINCYIKDTHEKAYQRAFFGNKHIQLIDEKGQINTIVFVEMEIPVYRVNGQSRRKSLDMIGKINKLDDVIIELKDEFGTSPFVALYKIVYYAKSIDKNIISNKASLAYHDFCKYKKSEDTIKDWRNQYKKCKYLIVAGPSTYWERWWDHLVKIKEVCKWIKKFHKYNIILASFSAIDFKNEKKKNNRYEPYIPKDYKKIWNVL